jgi:hypothetical protein
MMMRRKKLKILYCNFTANKISLGNIKYPSDKPDLDNESKPDTHCAC